MEAYRIDRFGSVERHRCRGLARIRGGNLHALISRMIDDQRQASMRPRLLHRERHVSMHYYSMLFQQLQ